MPFSSEPAPAVFTANGSATTLAIPWVYYDKSHVVAIHRASDGTLTTLTRPGDYDLTAAGDENGGTMTFVSTYAAGVKVYAWLDVPYDQQTRYKDGDARLAATLNKDLDKLVQRVAVVEELVKRSIKFPLPNTGTDGTIDGEAADLAGLLLGFNSSTGLPEGAVEASAVSAAMAPVIAAATLAAALELLAESVLTTRGDLMVEGASAPGRLGVGAANTVLKSDGTDPSYSTLTALLDAVFGSTRGMMLLRGSSSWGALAIGAAGTILNTDGADPSWGYWPVLPSAFRLTLTTGTPVTTSDVTAATTIYASPYIGNWLHRYNGLGWARWTSAEFSLALDSNAAHTGYHQSGKNFDLFAYYSGGTWYLCSGPAWTSDTARSAAISRVNGVWCNTSTMTLKYDASANTFSAAANQALYLGTFRATADGQASDTLAKRLLWNCYNRVPRALRRLEDTDTWTYSTATIRQANGSTLNQFEIVQGADEDPVSVEIEAIYACDSGDRLNVVGVGLDSTTANTSGQICPATEAPAANIKTIARAAFRGYVGSGYHKLTWLERADGVANTTWYGDHGFAAVTQSGMHGSFFA